MNGTKREGVQCVTGLDVRIAPSLKFSQHYKDAVGEANRMLGFININFSFKNKDVILPLYTSLATQNILCSSGPSYANDTAKLEAVQRRANKMITFLRNKPFEEGLARLNLQSLCKRRLQLQIIECFKTFNGFTNMDAIRIFSTDNT